MDKQQEEEKLKQELEELRLEIENFRQERERVRSIVGRVGGIPSFGDKLISWFFILAILGSLGASLFTHGVFQIEMMDIAIALISLKVIYIVHQLAKVNHFQLWILTSLEWRLNEISKLLKSQEKK